MLWNLQGWSVSITASDTIGSSPLLCTMPPYAALHCTDYVIGKWVWLWPRPAFCHVRNCACGGGCCACGVDLLWTVQANFKVSWWDWNQTSALACIKSRLIQLCFHSQPQISLYMCARCALNNHDMHSILGSNDISVIKTNQYGYWIGRLMQYQYITWVTQGVDWTYCYYRLLEITGDYWRLPEITRDYYRLLKITRDYWRLPEITRDYYRLLEITRDYWRLLEITTDYWRSLGLVKYDEQWRGDWTHELFHNHHTSLVPRLRLKMRRKYALPKGPPTFETGHSALKTILIW